MNADPASGAGEYGILLCMSTTAPAAGAPAETVLLIETLAANAWPPEQSITLDGWRLRSARGVTRRANSVWPNAGGELVDLEEKLAIVERYYTALGQPAIFQICAAAQPVTLDGLLAERGYSANSHTDVQVAPIQTLLHNLPPLRLRPTFELEVSEEFDAEWFALYCASEGVSGHAAAVRRSILQRIQPAHGFALLRHAGQPIAVGLGVSEGGWLGIFSMATLPAYRRQGAACAVLRTLAIWSQLYAAENVYLQVMMHNTDARQLYAKAGFTSAYGYHYREKKAVPSVQKID
jgi:ribosomal protein S18 acetylase RimI-like enzyme